MACLRLLLFGLLAAAADRKGEDRAVWSILRLKVRPDSKGAAEKKVFAFCVQKDKNGKTTESIELESSGQHDILFRSRDQDSLECYLSAEGDPFAKNLFCGEVTAVRQAGEVRTSKSENSCPPKLQSFSLENLPLDDAEFQRLKGECDEAIEGATKAKRTQEETKAATVRPLTEQISEEENKLKGLEKKIDFANSQIGQLTQAVVNAFSYGKSKAPPPPPQPQAKVQQAAEPDQVESSKRGWKALRKNVKSTVKSTVKNAVKKGLSFHKKKEVHVTLPAVSEPAKPVSVRSQKATRRVDVLGVNAEKKKIVRYTQEKEKLIETIKMLEATLVASIAEADRRISEAARELEAEIEKREEIVNSPRVSEGSESASDSETFGNPFLEDSEEGANPFDVDDDGEAGGEGTAVGGAGDAGNAGETEGNPFLDDSGSGANPFDDDGAAGGEDAAVGGAPDEDAPNAGETYKTPFDDDDDVDDDDDA